MAEHTDLAPRMEAVALEILGLPTRRITGVDEDGKRRNEMRYRKNDSLSVNLVEGRWYDHVAKSGGGVLTLLRDHKGLVGGAALDWLRVRGHLPARETVGSSTPRKVIEATYDYVDEDGVLLFQVVRYQPKSFAQRRPNPEVSGAWTYGVKGVRPVPYRLPELIEAVAHDRIVFIAEGEKKVDALAGLGIPATCNAGGSKKWRAEFGDHLRGARVVILPDNDGPGRDHRDQVTTMLTGVAASIHVLELPGLGEKGDIVNWIAAGGTAEELWRLVDAAPPAEVLPAAVEAPKADYSTEGAVAEAPPRPVITATPFVWVVPEAIPPRAWVYGRHYIKRFVTTTIAPGGVGKSSLGIAEALAIATGRPILGIKPVRRAKVWIWNGEDPLEELQRRIVAACLHHDISPEEIEGWLFVDSGRTSPLVVVTQTRAGITIAAPVVVAVKATILERGIEVVMIDPFISCHEVQENDNVAINTVATVWAQIADETDCAVDLVHHARKGSGGEVTVEDGRGASALNSKARSARALNPMTADEAEKAAVENRRLHFRTFDGKASLAPPSDESTWFRLVSVDLRNGTPERPSDSVGVVEAWKWPNAFDGVTLTDLQAVQQRVSVGGLRESALSPDWVGYKVAEILRLDPDKKADIARIKALLKTWIGNGALRVVDGKDDKGNTRPFIGLGTWAK